MVLSKMMKVKNGSSKESKFFANLCVRQYKNTEVFW